MQVESRRALLKNSGAGLVGVLLSGYGSSTLLAQEQYSDPDAADKWLTPLLHAPGAVAGSLHLGRFKDRTYYLDKEISWSPGPNQSGPNVVVPKGFVTDLASIPRVFWSVLPTDGAYTFPAIVHDYLYWKQEHSREVADQVFRYGMDDMKVSTVSAVAIHTAVRAGGLSAWRRNAQLKSAGEKRLLVEFPTDPTTTWSDWKKHPNCCASI